MKLTRSTKTIIKVIFVLGLLFLLAKKGFLSMSATKAALSDLPHIGIAYVLQVIALFIGIYRWQILLRVQGIEMPYKGVMQLAFVGNFFNIALPGAVSGDVVKAVYVGREVQGKRAQALSSILMDRVVGVSALVMVSALGLLFAGHESIALRPVVWFIAASGIGVVGFYTYLFLIREHHDPLLKLFKYAELKHPKFGSFTRIYEGIREHQSDRRATLYTLLLSMVIHTMVIFTFINFALALGETTILPLALCVIVPLGLLVTAIPILPAGVGTGHAAFLAFFHLIGSERGADAFTLFVLFQLFSGAMGGLVYLRFKSSPVVSSQYTDPKYIG